MTHSTQDQDRAELEAEARALGLTPDEADREVDDYLGMMGGASLDPLPEPEGHCPEALTAMLTQPAFMLSYLPTEEGRFGKRWESGVFRLDARADIETKIKAFVDDGTIAEFKATVVTGTLTCPKCNGTGTRTLAATANFSESTHPCSACDGDTKFDAPMWADLAPGLFTKRNGKVTLRKSPPNSIGDRRKNRTEARRYYVWRMARFNGGVDTHMPMEANWVAGGDPWMPVLDLFADAVALINFGSHSAGAEQWAAALGYSR